MRIIPDCLITLLILTLFAVSLPAKLSHNIELIDEAMVFGQYNDVAVSGDFAFCATGYGVRVISLRNPSNPRILYDYPTPGQASDILIIGDYAYVADGVHGLAVFSIEDPQNIELLRSITSDEGQYLTYIVHDNNRLYVYDKNEQVINAEQLRAFSLDDPSNPRLIRALPVNNTGNWTVSNNIKYWMHHGQLRRYSYEDLDNVEELEERLDLGFGYGESMLIVRGDYLYIVRGDDATETYFYVISMVDRENPEIVASLESDVSYSSAPRMVLYGNYAYLSTRFRDGHEIEIINIENHENPEPVGGFDERLKFYSDFLDYYLIDCKPGALNEGQFRVVSLENPESPELVSRLEAPEKGREIKELEIYSDHVYALSLRLHDFSLEYPWRVRENPWPFQNDSDPRGLAVYDAHLYVSGQYLYVYNLDDPDSPEALCYYDLDYPNTNFVIKDNHLVRTYRDHHIDGYVLCVYDVSGPDNIERIGEIAIENIGELKCVEINDSYVYAIGYDRTHYIYTFSIADPENPELVSRQAVSGAGSELRISDGLLFMPYRIYREGPRVFEGCGIKAFTIVEPDSFQEVGSIVLSRSRMPSIKFVQDRVLALGFGGEGFKIVSFEEPDNPQLIGWSSTHYSVGDIVIEGEIAVVADIYSVGIYDISQALNVTEVSEKTIPEKFELFPAYPNPFNSTTTIKYGLPFASHVSLSLFDLSGCIVTTLFEDYKQPGIHTTTLSAVNLPSGLYFVKLEASGQVKFNKAMLIR